MGLGRPRSVILRPPQAVEESTLSRVRGPSRDAKHSCFAVLRVTDWLTLEVGFSSEAPGYSCPFMSHFYGKGRWWITCHIICFGLLFVSALGAHV